MFRYQLGHMYFRYFMWNFSGRQNDIQGHGDFRYGNWISGIPFIDNILVGDQSVMPDTLKHDKANNKYYMLPFILGLLGMFYQYQRGKQGKKDFWVVMLLFFFTGIAIVLYLNQYPYQPRNVTMPMPDRSMPLPSGSVSGFSTCGIYFRRKWIPATQLLLSPPFACSPFR